MALDAMAGMRHLFYDRYHVMSSVERRAGGQGVVQFASIANTFDKVRVQLPVLRHCDLQISAPLRCLSRTAPALVGKGIGRP